MLQYCLGHLYAQFSALPCPSIDKKRPRRSTGSLPVMPSSYSRRARYPGRGRARSPSMAHRSPRSTYDSRSPHTSASTGRGLADSPSNDDDEEREDIIIYLEFSFPRPRLVLDLQPAPPARPLVLQNYHRLGRWARNICGKSCDKLIVHDERTGRSALVLPATPIGQIRLALFARLLLSLEYCVERCAS